MKHFRVLCGDTSMIDVKWYMFFKMVYLAYRYCGGIVRFERSEFTD